jgi:hypothetical protein
MRSMHLTSVAKPCCVTSLDIGHRLHMADIGHRLHMASNIGMNDVCTHGASFVCHSQFKNIFGMSYSKEYQECQSLYSYLNSY